MIYLSLMALRRWPLDWNPLVSEPQDFISVAYAPDDRSAEVIYLGRIGTRKFVHIRNYGFMANRSRKKKLALCRALIAKTDAQHSTGGVNTGNVTIEQEQYNTPRLCPACGKGYMICVAIIKPLRTMVEEITPYLAFDTS